ncbi:hypothetical protein ACFSTD_05200 [Novosphingobium colocasiae]|uniref:hypothetical protein n=1 Tax=Novosphingobium colocasiae TaxID=1256513 RepID=UPI001678A9F5|nr:hypothetical protein [Novosphingobium colocasiae]
MTTARKLSLCLLLAHAAFAPAASWAQYSGYDEDDYDEEDYEAEAEAERQRANSQMILDAARQGINDALRGYANRPMPMPAPRPVVRPAPSPYTPPPAPAYQPAPPMSGPMTSFGSLPAGAGNPEQRSYWAANCQNRSWQVNSVQAQNCNFIRQRATAPVASGGTMGKPYTAPGYGAKGASPSTGSAQRSYRVATSCMRFSSGQLINGCGFDVIVEYCWVNPASDSDARFFTCPTRGSSSQIAPGRSHSAYNPKSGRIAYIACEYPGLHRNVRWSGSSLQFDGCF